MHLLSKRAHRCELDRSIATNIKTHKVTTPRTTNRVGVAILLVGRKLGKHYTKSGHNYTRETFVVSDFSAEVRGVAK